MMYGYATVTADELAECRELHKRQKDALRALKTARYERLAAIRAVHAFRRKHQLSAERFQRYATRAGKMPKP
jgi:hypothetical protein